MKRARTGAIAAALLAAGLAFAAPSRGVAGPIRISGTGSSLGSMQVLGDAFTAARPAARIEVMPGLGSTGAIKAVIEGALDIGISARPLAPEEVRRGAIQAAYATTPFFFATAARTPVAGITLRDAVAVYNGTLSTWPDGTTIRLVLRPDLDSHNVILKAMSPEMERAVKTALSRKGMLMATTDQDCVRMIEKIPGAMGTATLTQIVTERRAVKALALDGASPTVANLASGAYPYYKTLYMVTGPRSSADAGRFCDFVRSPAARKILEKTGNLPIDVRPGSARKLDR